MNYWTLGSLMMMRNFSPFLIIRDVPLVCSDFPLCRSSVMVRTLPECCRLPCCS